mgnify:CR=1 FL=1
MTRVFRLEILLFFLNQGAIIASEVISRFSDRHKKLFTYLISSVFPNVCALAHIGDLLKVK